MIGRRRRGADDTTPPPTRGTASGRVVTEVTVVLQSASVLLQYPDDERLALREVVRDALTRVGGRRRGGVHGHLGGGAPGLGQLDAFLAATGEWTPRDLQEHYVRVLDRRRRACLYLTWWTDGETRRRGLSLAGLKELYRAHGFEFGSPPHDSRTAAASPEELPDFLPVMLEFAALVAADGDPAVGLDLLQRHRPGLELLRLALSDLDSPYRHPVEAVCALLPGTSPADEAAARALARSGPPGETVGLDGVPDGVLHPYAALGPTSLSPTFPVSASPAPQPPLTVTPPGGHP